MDTVDLTRQNTARPTGIMKPVKRVWQSYTVPKPIIQFIQCDFPCSMSIEFNFGCWRTITMSNIRASTFEEVLDFFRAKLKIRPDSMSNRAITPGHIDIYTGKRNSCQYGHGRTVIWMNSEIAKQRIKYKTGNNTFFNRLSPYILWRRNALLSTDHLSQDSHAILGLRRFSISTGFLPICWGRPFRPASSGARIISHSTQPI